MKRILLLKLSIRDFQGGTETIEFFGRDAKILAANGAGKTRLFSAFTYLLFGKDSLNRADFAIKNLDAQGNVADHGAQHTVEGVLNVDGEEVTLKKIYSEKYVKVRGKPVAEFSGHSTQSFINLVPKQENEYKAYIKSIAGDEQTFRILTNPAAFPQLPWQKQRAILLECFGDVSDAEIIASDPELAKLPEILGKNKVDDYKKILQIRQGELNKELGTAKIPGAIETRIDEVKRGIPDIKGLYRAKIEAEIQSIETSLNDAKLKKQGINTYGKIAEYNKEIGGINTELRKMETQHYSDTMKAANSIDAQIRDIENKTLLERGKVTTIANDIASKQRQMYSLENDIEVLRKKYEEVDAREFTEEFTDTTEEICAACQQPLPADRVAAAREKALAAFNNKKANFLKEKQAELDRIIEKSKPMTTEKDSLRVQIEDLKKEKETLEAGQDTGNDSVLNNLKADKDKLTALAQDYSLFPGYTELASKKVAFEMLIKKEQEGNSESTAVLDNNIKVFEESLKTAKSELDKFTKREDGEKRIAELKAEEKKLAAESEKMAYELNLIDKFTAAKVEKLNKKMTGQFEIVEWKLAEVQVNGAVNDQMCEFKVNGIGYSSGLNSAARTQGGMDIVKTLQKHHEISAPVFVDNRESVTVLPAMDCQVISLIVSEQDKALRVELEPEAVAA